MIEIKDKAECCGCGSCLQVCPVNAISMQEDEEGFLYPQVDSTTCVNCGACSEVCPVSNVIRKMRMGPLPMTYLGFDSDTKSREKSASGGAFIAIARSFINIYKGVVFGAAYDQNQKVYHTFSDNITDLHKFQKSKYVQSESYQSIALVGDYLKNNRYVLYSGTTCQIYGLKSYLSFMGINTERLFCIDLSCHGVPSPKVQREYIKDIEEKYSEKVRSLCNREKIVMKMTYQNCYSVTLSNGMKLIKPFSEDPMARCFFSGLISRPSCYNCAFKAIWRQSDLTLGDYWFWSEISKNHEDRFGISLILCQSNKGDKLIHECEGLELTIIDSENGIKCNGGMLYKSDRVNPGRGGLFQKLGTLRFSELANIYAPIGKKQKMKNLLRKVLVWKLGIYPSWEARGKHREYKARLGKELPPNISEEIVLSNNKK